MKRCPECGHKGPLKEKPMKHDLDGIAVVDGKAYVCPNCKAVHKSYVKMEALYQEVARELASSTRRLTGAELRWMRKYLGYSGTDWAEYLGVSRETVSRWENDQYEAPVAMERLLRMLVRLGPHVQEYGVPEEFAEAKPTKPEFRVNSAGNWVRV